MILLTGDGGGLVLGGLQFFGGGVSNFSGWGGVGSPTFQGGVSNFSGGVPPEKLETFENLETPRTRPPPTTPVNRITRCGSRIWSRGGPQVLRPKVADIAKRSCVSEASKLRPGSRACLRALEAFGFLMLKYAFSPHSRDSFSLIFDTYLTLKVDKNRTLHCTSINLRHSYILHLLFKCL